MIRHTALCALALGAIASTAAADLVISQYYNNGSGNKWIELFNSGASAVNLGNYSVGLWSDANAEGYKTGAAPTASNVLPSVSLSSGGVFLISHPDAAFPPGVIADLKVGPVMNFNGNDSFAIYTAGAYSTGSLVDAVGFTNTSTIMNRSYVRLSLDQGYSLASGSTVLNYPTIWSSTLVGVVNVAEPGTDARLGSTTLKAAVAVAAIPEPTAALFGSLVATVMGLTVARRPADRG